VLVLGLVVDTLLLPLLALALALAQVLVMAPTLVLLRSRLAAHFVHRVQQRRSVGLSSAPYARTRRRSFSTTPLMRRQRYVDAASACGVVTTCQPTACGCVSDLQLTAPLNLSYLQLTKVEAPFSFQGFVSVTALNLSNNKLVTVAGLGIEHMVRLHKLDLHNNSLKCVWRGAASWVCASWRVRAYSPSCAAECRSTSWEA
jgi:hypothetical protein